ncbi:MAG: TolC family protein, partial [Thiobacillaceae bacterium]
GETSSKIDEAIAKHQQSAAELEVARRQAATDARQAFEGIKNGLAQVDALESALRSGQSAVKGNVVGYRVGLRINSDVLNAQQQVYTTLHDLAKARYDTLFQGLKLKAAAGSLSEADVGTINALLVEGR